MRSASRSILSLTGLCRPSSEAPLTGPGQRHELAVTERVRKGRLAVQAHAPVFPSTPSRSRSTCPQCWAYSVIIRSTSQRRSTSSFQSSGRAVSSRSWAATISRETAHSARHASRSSAKSASDGRVEVEVGIVCVDEEERDVAALEVLLEPPTLDAGEVSDQAVN